MNHPRYWSVLVLPLLGASACIEAPSGEMNAEMLEAATASVRVHETNGQWFVGAPTINIGDPILEEGGGRLFQITQVLTIKGEAITKFIFSQNPPLQRGRCRLVSVAWSGW